jgi:hypothetical protein
MFGVNWSDPQTLWLNVVNFGLGAVTLICFIALGYGLMQDVRARARRRATERSFNGRDIVASLGGHAFHMPELGMTMADGGEPVEEKPAKGKKRSPKGK